MIKYLIIVLLSISLTQCGAPPPDRVNTSLQEFTIEEKTSDHFNCYIIKNQYDNVMQAGCFPKEQR